MKEKEITVLKVEPLKKPCECTLQNELVQQRLGHSDVNITLNTYTHVLPEMDARGDKIRPDFATKSIG